VAQPNFKEVVYFHENLLGVLRYKTSVKLKLPIYLGASILELSKLVMYKFYYEKMPLIFNNVNYKLCYMDTDSFIFYFEDHDFVPYARRFPEFFDFSDYPPEHVLHNTSNKKIPGVFKDELNGDIMLSFVSLAPKMYAYKTYESNKEVKKAKGVLKHIIERDLTFDAYKKCLFENDTIIKPQRLFHVKGHEIQTIQQNKTALTKGTNNKRIYYDNINSYAIGHYKLKDEDSTNDDTDISE